MFGSIAANVCGFVSVREFEKQLLGNGLKALIAQNRLLNAVPMCCGAFSKNIKKPIMKKLHWAIKIRKILLIKGSWKWNAIVRDLTAKLETL